MKIANTIFREYDIRGIAGEEFSKESLLEYEKWYGKFPGITLTREAAIQIGKAYGSIISSKGGKKVIVGHENRPYGEELKKHFIEGVLSTGVDVVDAGISLTPLIYFSIAFYDYDGGVNVTGSHNVYFFNGFKLMGKNVNPIFGQELQQMKKMINNEEYAFGHGTYSKTSVKEDYLNYLKEHVMSSKRLKVVVDTGNGSAGLFAPELLRALGHEVIELYSEPDATFPNHVPDPEDPFMMKDLCAKVIAEGADCGIGLDADGDRCGVVDEKGNFIYADRILLLFAKDALSRNEGKKIVFDVKCTRLLEDLVSEFGGIPVMHRTGHAPIKKTLHDDPDTIFAGEVSGHFFFVENYFKIDDGLFAAAKLLAMISSYSKPLSHILSQFPHTIMTPEMKLPCSDEIKHQVVKKAKMMYEKDYKVIEIDGARIVFSPTSWGLVRASNTSPYLTIRVEADTEEEVIKIKNSIQDVLDQFNEIEDKLDRKNVTSHTGRLGWV